MTKAVSATQRAYCVFVSLSAVLLLIALQGPAHSQAGSFVAPPRTIADITAILDQEKPDPERIAKMRTDADAPPPLNAAPGALVVFYYDRGVARLNIGRFRDSITDLEAGIALGLRSHVDIADLRQVLGYQYNWSGDNRKALEEFFTLARESESGKRGYLFSAYRWISFLSITLGDLEQADLYLKKNEALLVEARAWPDYQNRKTLFLAHVEYTRGRFFEAHGKLNEAEAAYRRAELLFTELLGQPVRAKQSSRQWSVAIVRDNMIASQGVVKAKQGRYAEAEADARRALLNRLASVGKYNLTTATLVIPRFASVLLDQGRYKEAQKLIRTELEIFDALGVARDSQYAVVALKNLASLQALQAQWSEAALSYAAIDKATESWEAERKAQLVDFERILTLYNTDRVDDGIAAANQLVSRSIARFGPKHVYTAYAQAAVAVGLSRQRRDVEALEKFRAATPVILAAGQSADTEDPINAAAHDQRTKLLIEDYLSLLARSPDKMGAANESFPLADAIRNRSVQRALTQSGARAVAGDAKLAELARREQDTTKEITAQLNLLNEMLARPKEQRDETSTRDLQARVDELRIRHQNLRDRLAAEFPAYLKLIDPKSPAIGEIRRALKPDEAMLSFYIGSRQSFVWVISAREPVAFAAIDLTAAEIAAKVSALRKALEPQVTMVNDIPPFNLTLAYDIYKVLLKPIEASWWDAKSLIVVTNGALGELPLTLLPTAPSQVDPLATPLFAGYRNVPWLARTHAVTVIPSASALVMLRRLPPESPSRETLIGFGDPYFNAEQAARAEEELSARQTQVASVTDLGAVATRGIALKLRASPHTEEVDKAELAALPRLPDTRSELMSIAKALDADPIKSLYLGKDANERNVETLDLSRYRIVAFATHGLVPGDLDGLTQPALALTAPDVAGIKSDGLLTMEKILALKLNADWVLLSACNTAAGAGAGAEAASGLGRAFFYAGSRAILVTNWAVHSASARELVSDLFRRQAADSVISRAEALRQAMMALIDGRGYQDDKGNTLFAYAHPLFWAPYTIIGDGG